MDGNDMALIIGAQIAAIRRQRDETQDAAKKAAANEAIEALQAKRAEIIVAEADAFDALVESAVADLEEIQNRHGTDAITAIGAAADRLREVGGTG